MIYTRFFISIVLLVLLQSCTHLAIDDCGGKVLGENKPRIRSSHLRMFLADPPAASNRFAPYAAMSALAYAEAERVFITADVKMTPNWSASIKPKFNQNL